MQHQPIRLIQPNQFQLYLQLQLQFQTTQNSLPAISPNTIMTHLQTYKIINSPRQKLDQLTKGIQKEYKMYKIYEHSGLNQIIQHYYGNMNLEKANNNDTSLELDGGRLYREGDGEGGEIGEMGGGVKEVGICQPGFVYFLCEQNDIQSIEQVKQLLQQQIIARHKKKLEQNSKPNQNKQLQNDTKTQEDLQQDVQSDKNNFIDSQAQTYNPDNSIKKCNLSCTPFEQTKCKLSSNQNHSVYRGKKSLNKDRVRNLSTVGQRFRKDIKGKENYMKGSSQFVNVVFIKDGQIYNQFQSLRHSLIKDHCLNSFNIYYDKDLQNKADAHTLTATKDSIYYLKHKNSESQPCSPRNRSAARPTILRGSSNLKQEQVLKKIRIYRSLHKQNHISQQNTDYSYCNVDCRHKNDMQKSVVVDKQGRRGIQEHGDGVKGQNRSFKVRNLWRKEKQMKKSEKLMQILKVYCKQVYGKVTKQQKQQKMKKSE